MPDNLFLEERRSHILEQLQQKGRVSVKNLSESLKVSAVTIRQDLQALEFDGLLKRTHGGAVLPLLLPTPALPALSEQAFEIRRRKFAQEKEAIGRTAAALVKDGYGVALDSSTTAFAITPYLRQLENLVIVTNSLLIAQQFIDCPTIEVILPGGRLRADSVSLVGKPETLPNVNFNVGFFGAYGVTVKAGFVEMSQAEGAIKHAMMLKCVTRVIIVDSSKWGVVAPYTFATLQDVHQIITNSAPPEIVAEFRDIGVVVQEAQN